MFIKLRNYNSLDVYSYLRHTDNLLDVLLLLYYYQSLVIYRAAKIKLQKKWTQKILSEWHYPLSCIPYHLYHLSLLFSNTLPPSQMKYFLNASCGFSFYIRLSYCNLNQTRFFERLIYQNLTFCNCLVNAKNIFIKYFFHYKLHRTLTEGNLSHYISVSSKTNTLQLNKLQIKYWRLKNVKRPGSSISLISKISWASCHYLLYFFSCWIYFINFSC